MANIVKTNEVVRVDKRVAEVTNFNTLDGAEKVLTSLVGTDNETRYLIGSVFNAVKEKKLVDNVEEWAAKYGFKGNTVYQLGSIAKNFTLADISKWGVGKLIEFRNSATLKKLESNGITPDNTSKEIREKVKESKERKTTGPRKKSMKTLIKEDIKIVSTLTNSIKLLDGKGGDHVYEFLKSLSYCGGSREKVPELYEHLDKAMIILCEYEEVLNKKLNEIEFVKTEELKKKEEKEKRKAEKAKNNK